ncbi:hypothetical protein [Staphylococcus epidermidis]
MKETKTLIVNIIGVMISCFYILALNIVIFWFLLYLFNNHFKGIEMIFSILLTVITLIVVIGMNRIFYRINIKQIVEEYGVMHFYIIDQEFKSICNFFIAGNGSNEITKSLIKRYDLILEIKALHSYSKNKGKVIVNRLKELSNNANIPICLFDTNNKSDNYYINLGFINKGQIGVNGERLVVYEPR